MRLHFRLFHLMTLAVLAVCASVIEAADPVEWRPSQTAAMESVDRHAQEILDVNREIWTYAEVGLQEHKSSTLLIEKLETNGFKVESGVADIPTAFVASYGSGRPIIGILAEYDALPGLSQKVAPERDPLEEGANGHGCGHSGLGSGALGAAIAVKEAMEKNHLPGTIRLYGTPAEETVIGKIYMLLGGQFKDLDVCLHWHPSSKNQPWYGSSKAVVSAKFTFHGLTAHASGSPEAGRSALDGVELMNVGVNFMREHIKEDARMHYVITNGGGAPNVVPPTATVWYFVRADSHEDVEANFKWLRQIADGAALMSRTKVDVQIDTDCHEIIQNRPLAELIYSNMVKIGAPTFSQEEQLFARRLQQPLIDEFGTKFPVAVDEQIYTVDESASPSKGSTDVGDISWFVPTGGLRTSCFIAQGPGHSWQNVACIASPIGEKGILYASKILAVTALDLLEQPDEVAKAKADFDSHMKGRTYTTLIPKGQKPPATIR